ncbi:MAG: SH3 domain-containing protein [Prevotella sp.]|nr:SH3 domain-containing protein [Prevotella sp.]
MKKLLLMILAAMLILPCAAQRFGLVKDEGGFTNIRKGPGTNYPVVEQVQDGSFISFDTGIGSWYKVYTTYTDGTPQEMIGYIHSSKVVVPKKSKGVCKNLGFVVDEDGYTNVRKGPGTRYAIVGKVRDGSFILCSGDYDDGWYKVYTQTGVFRGYMSASRINITESPCF